MKLHQETRQDAEVVRYLYDAFIDWGRQNAKSLPPDVAQAIEMEIIPLLERIELWPPEYGE